MQLTNQVSKIAAHSSILLLVGCCIHFTNAEEMAPIVPPKDVMIAVEKIVKGTTTNLSNVKISDESKLEYVPSYIACPTLQDGFTCAIFPTLGFLNLRAGGGDSLILNPSYLTPDSIIKDPSQNEGEDVKLDPKLNAVILASVSGRLNYDSTRVGTMVFQNPAKYLCVSKQVFKYGSVHRTVRILFKQDKEQYVVAFVSWGPIWMSPKDYADKFEDVPRDVLGMEKVPPKNRQRSSRNNSTPLK